MVDSTSPTQKFIVSFDDVQYYSLFCKQCHREFKISKAAAREIKLWDDLQCPRGCK